MKWHVALWRRLADTQALRDSSGQHETDFFAATYRVMYLAGFSRSERGSGYKLYSYCVAALIAMYVSGVCWYLVTLSASLDEVVANLTFVVMNIIAVYWYWTLVKNKNIFKQLAASMESPYLDVSTPTRQEIVRIWVAAGDRYLRLLLALGNCSVATWYITPLIDDVPYNLFINFRVPYDYETPVRYALTYALMVAAFYYYAYFVMINDQVRQAHLVHLLCQYNVLADCFENIIEDCSGDFAGYSDEALFSNESFQKKFTDQLRKCITQHQFLLDQTEQFSSILSTPMLFQFGISSISICFTAYQVATAVSDDLQKFVMTLLYLAYNLFSLFVFCRWCEEIKGKSEAIGRAVYECGWERGLAARPAVRAALLIVAARASRPMTLTAGGVYDLSLESYASLLKTSYSALTMLLQVRHE